MRGVSSVSGRYDDIARQTERLVVLALIVCGAMLIVVPLALARPAIAWACRQ